ncbi:MAG: DUF3108 domain-containing protein [bacterium]
MLILFMLLSYTLPSYEELVYSVKYGVMTAGELRLEYKQDSLKGNYVRCEERTNGVMGFIFSIEDWYESFSDSNFTTQRFEKDIKEGNYKKHLSVVIENGQATYQDGKVVPVVDSAKDIINIWYWLRTQELVPGDTITVALHADKKNHKVKTVIREEKVNGRNCIAVVPNLTGIKTFGSKGGIVMYYDEDRTPVKFTVKFKWGDLEVELKRRSAN